jgi:hypothetical protein
MQWNHEPQQIADENETRTKSNGVMRKSRRKRKRKICTVHGEKTNVEHPSVPASHWVLPQRQADSEFV